MRKIGAIAWNEVQVFFSERATLIFFLVLPVVFTAVLGSTLGGGDETGDARYAVLVVDEDRSAVSAELIGLLEVSDVIRPEVRAADEVERLFDEDDAPALLVIPGGFGEAVMAGRPAALTLRGAPGDSRALAVNQALQAAASELSHAVSAARVSVDEIERRRPFETESARQTTFQEALAFSREALREPPVRVEVTRSSTTGTESPGAFEQASAGQLVTWVLFTLIGTGYVLVDERRRGTLRRTLVTPTSKAAILAGKVGARFGLGVVQMAILMGFGALVFGVEWGRSPVALVLVMLAFALASVAFGVMLAAFARTSRQADGLTTFSSLLLAALGGAWWPMEITPELYQTVTKILPTTWAMRAFYDVMGRGRGPADVLPEVAVLLGFAVVFFIIGIWRFDFE